MSIPELISQAKALAGDAVARAGEYSGALMTARQYVLDNYGQTGLIAAYVTIGVLAVFIVSRLVMMTFAAVKWMVLPSIVLAFLASLVLPIGFGQALPVTVAFCSLVLLFKG
ncbi:MAG: hypothetical protein AB1772_11270 [Candidatus Zixiibacteriota bacterium]